ncbi:MAG: hypothetical protein Q4E54_07065 [Lachnospiraceae bacterium]|nr:hypothetical protein [Lachnospiraceae bacterium]
MALDYTKKTTHRSVSLMDLLHTILAVAAVVIFIILVKDFDANRKLLPFIMLIAAIMNGADCLYKIQHLPHGKKNFGGIFVSIGLTAVFLFLSGFMWIVFFW